MTALNSFLDVNLLRVFTYSVKHFAVANPHDLFSLEI